MTWLVVDPGGVRGGVRHSGRPLGRLERRLTIAHIGRTRPKAPVENKMYYNILL